MQTRAEPGPALCPPGHTGARRAQRGRQMLLAQGAEDWVGGSEEGCCAGGHSTGHTAWAQELAERSRIIGIIAAMVCICNAPRGSYCEGLVPTLVLLEGGGTIKMWGLLIVVCMPLKVTVGPHLLRVSLPCHEVSGFLLCHAPPARVHCLPLNSKATGPTAMIGHLQPKIKPNELK